jgi:hypothetical protein
MSKIILDPELRGKLNGLTQQVEVCDESGRTVGHFVPVETYEKLLYALAEAQRPQRSGEDIEKRRRETGGRTLPDIWKALAQS